MKSAAMSFQKSSGENKVDIQSELDEKIERWLLNNDNEVDHKFVEVAEFELDRKRCWRA